MKSHHASKLDHISSCFFGSAKELQSQNVAAIQEVVSPGTHQKRPPLLKVYLLHGKDTVHAAWIEHGRNKTHHQQQQTWCMRTTKTCNDKQSQAMQKLYHHKKQVHPRVQAPELSIHGFQLQGQCLTDQHQELMLFKLTAHKQMISSLHDKATQTWVHAVHYQKMHNTAAASGQESRFFFHSIDPRVWCWKYCVKITVAVSSMKHRSQCKMHQYISQNSISFTPPKDHSFVDQDPRYWNMFWQTKKPT